MNEECAVRIKKISSVMDGLIDSLRTRTVYNTSDVAMVYNALMTGDITESYAESIWGDIKNEFVAKVINKRFTPDNYPGYSIEARLRLALYILANSNVGMAIILFTSCWWKDITTCDEFEKFIIGHTNGVPLLDDILWDSQKAYKHGIDGDNLIDNIDDLIIAKTKGIN